VSVLLLLIPLSILLAAGFLGAFVWAVRTGQYDDTATPAVRPLFDDPGRDGPSRNSSLLEDTNP
jgi:cbb3-type cytochrome oxidase maturation protein